MEKARFILSRRKVVEQYNKLKDLGVKISYSYKTNNEVGHVLEDKTESEFSIHATSKIDDINDKDKIWFFMQANSNDELIEILNKGVKRFVIDNEIDLENLLRVVKEKKVIIDLLIRMKFQEHRITAGKYFIYGMESKKVNELIAKIKDNGFIDKLGIHIHRKSQNASEWEIKEELIDSLSDESLNRLDIINIGGGLPVRYRTYTSEIMPYIFDKIKEVKDWFNGEVYVEPGRFIAGPAIKLVCNIIQIQNETIIVNTSIYNGVLDSHITDIRLLVEEELSDNEEGTNYKIKGNTPTRDDIFRHKVRLKNVKVGDEIVFLNAGAYNYTTDFCGLKKLETIYEDNKIIVVPSSQGSLGKNKGCEKGGETICKDVGVDYEIAELVEGDFIETTKKIENLEGDVFVGGDHSITYGLFKKSGADSLIIFDAHADCVNNFSPPTHEDFVRVLIEEGHVKPENVLLIGLRNVDLVEKEYLKDKGIKYIYWGEVGCNLYTVIKEFIDGLNKVYLSVDIDVLDGEKYVGTGYPEKGGFSLDQLKEFVKEVLKSGKVVRSDLVEVNPSLDKDGETVGAGGDILKFILGV